MRNNHAPSKSKDFRSIWGFKSLILTIALFLKQISTFFLIFGGSDFDCSQPHRLLRHLDANISMSTAAGCFWMPWPSCVTPFFGFFW